MTADPTTAERLPELGDPVRAVEARLLTARLPRPWGPEAPENHVIVVTVSTESGRQGTGFAWTPTVGPTAVLAALRDDLAPRAVGLEPDPVAVWGRLWLETHEAGDGLMGIALAGVDTALWDLRARSAEASVAALLGASRRALPAYGSGVNRHYPLPELVAQAERWVAAGFDAVKVKVGGRETAEDLDRLRAVREVIGPGRALMIDANQLWDVPAAVAAIDRLAEVEPAWVEEPLLSDDLAGYRALREEVGVPIAAGENLRSRWAFERFLEAGVLDVVQPNVVRVGGITPALEIAALVADAGARLAFHLLPELSAPLAAALPDAGAIEIVEDATFDRLGLVRAAPFTLAGGTLTLSDRPGLGLDFVTSVPGAAGAAGTASTGEDTR
ncbi:mandelate racemase/muconate lactonizing enzyme family protein [Gryllotalpicola ginsengisoli]|uniref:mandelate racemase/muconate lactonizing enzyme family protein n=1 Tax=Gryllotalpicola ginsengisoli TaxID=444608 RepID=UPI0003F80596|nr:mandelate racemase/muconate lactonizing enzyme family protein [Gryllotalpicola ginsengisoli]